MCSWCIHKILGAHCRHEEGRERDVWRKKKKWMTTIVINQTRKKNTNIKSNPSTCTLVSFPRPSPPTVMQQQFLLFQTSWGGTTFCCCVNVGGETRCQPVLSSQLFLTRFTHLAGIGMAVWHSYSREYS